MPALLHALASLTAPQFSLALTNSVDCPDEEAVPIISLPCRWKLPKKRKESTMPMSVAIFTKHAYDKTKKRKLEPLEDFDPRPM